MRSHWLEQVSSWESWEPTQFILPKFWQVQELVTPDNSKSRGWVGVGVGVGGLKEGVLIESGLRSIYIPIPGNWVASPSVLQTEEEVCSLVRVTLRASGLGDNRHNVPKAGCRNLVNIRLLIAKPLHPHPTHISQPLAPPVSFLSFYNYFNANNK